MEWSLPSGISSIQLPSRSRWNPFSHSYDVLDNFKETKTKACMRLLPLTESLCESLKAHKQAQLARYEKTNSYRKPHEGYITQDDSSPVISDNSGTRILPGGLSRWWTEDRAKFGAEGWCLHELRHAYLTMLALSSVHPKVMQELAGHYSSQITWTSTPTSTWTPSFKPPRLMQKCSKPRTITAGTNRGRFVPHSYQPAPPSTPVEKRTHLNCGNKKQNELNTSSIYRAGIK